MTIYNVPFHYYATHTLSFLHILAADSLSSRTDISETAIVIFRSSTRVPSREQPNTPKAMQWIERLDAGLSQSRTEFDGTTVHLEPVVEEVALE
jgi:hypothetical protein